MRMLRWTNLLLAGSLLLVLGSAGCSSSSGVVTPAGPTSPTSPTSPTAPTGPV